MLKDLTGTNALTVLVGKSEEKQKTKVFFCPYTRDIVLKYQGDVKAVLPGYDSEQNPQFFVRPQRSRWHGLINYIFQETNKNYDSVDFWIQSQYFQEDYVKTYYCWNCQSPQLYYDTEKAVLYNSKSELKPNSEYLCDNCKLKLNYMGIVAIQEPVLNFSHGE